jgi:peptide/nickel transport system substrate-binding protein
MAEEIPMKRRDLMLLTTAGLALPRLARSQEGKVLRFVPQADLALLDPVATTAFVTRNHGFLVYDTLYGVDENFTAHPQMVEGHVTEQDGKLWKLTLREGLRFHDGEPVRARDVVASLNRWGQRDTYGFDLMAAIDELSAPSDGIVQFRLKKPFPTLADVLGKAGTNMPCIMPERLASTDPVVPVSEVIGSGPFRFVASQRVPGALNVYERFAGYVPRNGGSPSFLAGPKIAHLERVEWRTMPDPATAAAALQSGEIDWWEQPIPDLLPVLSRGRATATDVHDKAGFLALLRLNHEQPPFNNAKIRQALFAALDQADFMTAVAGSDPRMWQKDIGFFTPGPMTNDAGMEALRAPRDVNKARQMLKDAGYRGEKVALMAPTDFASINALSQVTGDLFNRIGLNVDYQAVDWGTVVQRWNSKQPVEQGGWSAFCTFTTGASTINPADNKFIRGLGDRGIYGWPVSERIESLRAAFLDAPDLPSQKEICQRMQLAAFEDVPYVPLGVFFQPTAFRRNVSGMLSGFPLFYNIRKSA